MPPQYWRSQPQGLKNLSGEVASGQLKTAGSLLTLVRQRQKQLTAKLSGRDLAMNTQKKSG